MSDEENFLSRWSQRKREAGKPDPSSTTDNSPPSNVIVEAPEADQAEEQFDLSTLPDIADVNETTDITAFMRKGVPESLRNAALSKSWALDPAIRNYVNPALEYAYDWNTPGGVPGTSELATGTDIVKMVAQIMGVGDSDKSDETSTIPTSADGISISKNAQDDAAVQIAQPEFNDPAVRLTIEKPTEPEISVAIDENASEKKSFASQQGVRRHGTARPRV